MEAAAERSRGGLVSGGFPIATAVRPGSSRDLNDPQIPPLGKRALLLAFPQPLANGVVRNPIDPAHGQVPELVDLLQQLFARRPDRLARCRSRPSATIPAGATFKGAVAVSAVSGPEALAAAKAVALRRRPSVLAAAVGVQSRGAVGTDDSKVLESVVVVDAIDVVEDHRHRLAAPELVLSTQFAHRS